MIQHDTIRRAMLFASAVQSTLHVCVIRDKQDGLFVLDSTAQIEILK
jgi:hypothetical protein